MSSQTLPTDMRWIAEKAATDPEVVFYTIVHYIDEVVLGDAFHRLRKDAASGIDGQTAAEYAEDLIEKLRDVHERLRTKQYRATEIKRGWLPKDDGSQRPIGMLILEDKTVQKAVSILLEADLAIKHGKHVAMVNKETDSVIGPMLHQLAKKAGVIYTPVECVMRKRGHDV